MGWTNGASARELARALWRDETGVVLSAELVLLATLGVIGATVGLTMASSAVNDELSETAFAIRSLDQSYVVRGQCSARAYVAGSQFIQRPVARSHAELRQAEGELQNEAAERRRASEERLERMWQEQQRDQEQIEQQRRQRIEEERRRVREERRRRNQDEQRQPDGPAAAND